MRNIGSLRKPFLKIVQQIKKSRQWGILRGMPLLLRKHWHVYKMAETGVNEWCLFKKKPMILDVLEQALSIGWGNSWTCQISWEVEVLCYSRIANVLESHMCDENVRVGWCTLLTKLLTSRGVWVAPKQCHNVPLPWSRLTRSYTWVA